MLTDELLKKLDGISDGSEKRLRELSSSGEPGALKGARRVRRGVEGRSLADVTLPTLLPDGRASCKRDRGVHVEHGDG